MFITDIKQIVDQVSRDKGIDRDILIQALEEALKSGARKKYGNQIDIEAQYNEEAGEIEVFQFKEVVEEITEPDLQISLEEGRKLDADCEIGDSLGTKMDASTFGRIAAQSAKQVIIQKIKDAEKVATYSTFITRKGEIINGIVQRIDRGDIIVNLGQTEGILPGREQVPRENYRRGDRIRAYILDVLEDTRGPQIVLSRTHPNFLINLFKTEVPEISEGIVNIMGAAREPGVRAKFAVASTSSDIDPVGACVGMKGSRVQNVVQELKGEKIDIISWHVDPAKFVCNSLAPAEISRVIIDEDNRSMEVIVPDEFLSIAIGKKGQNVRLASKLSGWHLDVKSETLYSEAMKSGYESLVALPGVGVSMADALYEKGLFSAEEISRSTVDDLIQIRGIGEGKAKKLITAANQLVKTAAEEAESEEMTENEPEEVTESEPEDVTEDEPEDVTESEPEDVTEDESEEATESEPEDVTEDEPEDVTESEPEDVTEDESEEVTEDESEEVTESEPEDVTEDESEDVTESEPEDVTEDESEELTEDKPDNKEI